jgi:hypothetical protein
MELNKGMKSNIVRIGLGVLSLSSFVGFGVAIENENTARGNEAIILDQSNLSPIKESQSNMQTLSDKLKEQQRDESYALYLSYLLLTTGLVTGIATVEYNYLRLFNYPSQK